MYNFSLLKKITAAAFSLLIILSLFAGCDEAGKNEPSPFPAFEIEGKLQIYCYSIGSADAFLIYTENSAVLIDTGTSETDSDVYEYIKDNCSKKLDALIITHFDIDHVGGAVKILKKCTIDRIIRTEYAKDTKEYENYSAAIEYYGYEETIPDGEMNFTLDGVEYTVCPPEQKTYKDDTSNNSSLIVSVKYGENSFLFMGDAQKERVKEFFSSHFDKYDFVKMPHHGRWFKALGTLISTVVPEYAVITSSEKEKEDETTMQLLEQSDVSVFLTRVSPVLVKCDGKNISVSYCD